MVNRSERARTETNKSIVQERYVALLGSAPDPTSLNGYVGQLNNGTSIENITQQIVNLVDVQDEYGDLSGQEAVTRIYRNAFDTAPLAADLTRWAGEWATPGNRASVVNQILGSANTNPTLQRVLGNKVSVAKVVTDSVGTNLVFTRDNDILLGTSGNDVFIGDANSVQATDQIIGGSGTDTFQYYNASNVLPRLQGVERVELINADTFNFIDFSATPSLSGLKEVTLKFNPQQSDVVIAGLRDIRLGIDNVTNGNDITARFGNGSDGNISLVDSRLNTLRIEGDRVETVNIDVKSEFNGGVNTISSLTNLANVRNINITGDAGLRVTDRITLNPTAQTTVNASANSGGVGLTFDNGRVNFTGSSGDDTIGFVLANFDTQDRVDGGSGTDKLVLLRDVFIPFPPLPPLPPLPPVVPPVVLDNTQLNAVNAAQNIEILRLQLNPVGNLQRRDLNALTVDAQTITAVNRYEFAVDTVNLSNAAANDRFTLDGTSRLNLQGAAQASVDLTLENVPLETVPTVGLTPTLNLTSDRNNNTTVAGRNVITRLVSDVDGLRINVNNVVTPVAQSRPLTIGGIQLPGDTATGVTINAETFTADFNATGTALNDTFIFDATRFFGRNATLQGGAGTDTLELRQGTAPNILADLTATGNAQLPTNVAVINNRAQGIEILRLNGTTLTADAGQITGINRFEFVNTSGLREVTLRGADQNDRITLNSTRTLTLDGAQQRVNLTLENIPTLTLVSDRNGNISPSTNANQIDTLQYDNQGLTINVVTAIDITTGIPRGADGLGNQDRDLIIAAPTLPPNAIQGIRINASVVGQPAFTGRLTVTGTALDDVLTGGSGNNTLTGGDGNDILRVITAGDHRLDGGAGDDTIILESAAFNDLNNNDSINGGTGRNTLVLRSNDLVLTTNDNDLTGIPAAAARTTAINAINAAQNIQVLRLEGTNGVNPANSVIADAGLINIREYEFDAGQVTLRNANQNDQITLESTNTLTLQGAQQRVNLTLDDNIQTLTLVSDRNNNTSVSTTPNRIDTLQYGDETLTINLIGSGRTADTVGDGNQDRNLIIAAPTLPENATRGIRINASGVGGVQPAFTGRLEVTGTALNDTLIGGSGNNILIGGAGNDTLIGGAVNDTLIGGLGGDRLTGGGGVNTFVYTSAADSNRSQLGGAVSYDTITDFKPGTGDRIDLVALGLTRPQFVGQVTPVGATLAAAVNNAATLIGVGNFGYFNVPNSVITGGALGTSTFILATNQTPQTTDDLLIQLNGNLALTTNDFTLAV
ncbi:beta strand repeat-containing protein [Anabaenopsis elenkinii]|uniref:Calcium-binding protein n=1 Tax=Anabaenopsis elenkinii CCIBt3563 TaxID=2779889 RepID=A0A7S6RD55_9CYAN|nr:calcium-binding protein [Anabaenopsis elenkinii]QOV22631.1 calcium-binding protein [Anabaenopsis elenkinii CCIBt3563]